MKEVYLGDGVYLKFDGERFELYTSDGIEKTNMIILEPEVMKALHDVVWGQK